MKRLLTLIVLLSFAVCAFAQTGTQRPGSSRGNRALPSYGNTVTWHKKVVTGVDSLYDRGTIEPTVNGAGDSLYSDVYYNNGRENVQFEIMVDATPTAFTVYIEVQTANAGDDALMDIPDARFKSAGWLIKGSGVDENIFVTDLDSITTVGVTGTIQLAICDAEYFRFLVITSPIASDVNVVKAYLNRQER